MATPVSLTYPPRFMGKGSKGPAVKVLLQWLKEVLPILTPHVDVTGLIVDDEYGEHALRCVGEFQDAHKIKADGVFGPKTRALAKDRYGFDFVARAKETYGITEFAAPGRPNLYWAPGYAPARHRGIIRQQSQH